MQIRLVSDGYDPMLGIMHSDQEYALAFVFDMMEPERPKVDRAVLAFLKSEALHPADFTPSSDCYEKFLAMRLDVANGKDPLRLPSSRNEDRPSSK